MTTKLLDSKGRVCLGDRYAGATMLVEEHDDGRIVLTPAVTVPAMEAWLWRNNRAMRQVQEGLQEAADGKFVDGPDLKKGRTLADKIKE